MTGKVSLLAILKTMESVVQTYMSFGTHSSKPISVNMGTGFKQVWMWVLIELPMDYL